MDIPSSMIVFEIVLFENEIRDTKKDSFSCGGVTPNGHSGEIMDFLEGNQNSHTFAVAPEAECLMITASFDDAIVLLIKSFYSFLLLHYSTCNSTQQ